MNDFEQEYEDTSCERCGCCETYWESCQDCGGDGFYDGEYLMEEDPLWYGPNDTRRCNTCNGKGGWKLCLGDCDKNGKHKPHTNQ